MDSVLSLEGCNYFRQRLVLATLSSRPIRITKIRENGDEPGLKEYEAGFIRLMDKLTNGSKIEINETGTTLRYYPGLLVGGTLDHDCSQQRSIGYVLEPLILLAPFMKKRLKITLRGVTNGPKDPSVDYYRMCVIPLLKKFVADNDLELKICHRGVWPEGSGEVYFSCPTMKRLKPVFLTDPGKVRRVRGVAYCVRVNPSMANRMVDSARSVLNRYLPDVYIYTDVVRGTEVGKSPGYGITLVAETTTGVTYAAEATTISSPPTDPLTHTPQAMTNDSKPSSILPEDLGKEAASRLLEEIVKGGCSDSASQVIPLLFMALGQKDVSKIQLGELSPYSIQFIRHVNDFLHLMYKVEGKEEELGREESQDEMEDCDYITRQAVSISCVGIGFSNFSKGIL